MSLHLAKANAAPPPPAPFVQSAVVRTHSAWRYLWPFQSRKALIFTSVLFAVSLPLITLLMWLINGDFHFVLNGLIGGVIGGMYCGVYRCLPARMTITTRADACHTVEDLKRMIPTIAYRVAAATEDGHIHYCHKWAGKLHGWATWDEQDLHVRWSGQQIDLLGPVAVIGQLERRLCGQLGI